MNTETTYFWIVIGAVIATFVIGKIQAAKAAADRKQRIYKKYGHTEIAENIIAKLVWTGETATQLYDSMGQPLDVDQKVLKTKKKEIWKYYQTGTNRYSLKITLDNDVVVGWDHK